MTTAADLLAMAEAALLGPGASAPQPVYATDAGALVFRPGDWPTQDGQYPLWKLRVVRESKRSLGKGGPPEFAVTATIRLEGQVSAPAEVRNGGAAKAELALWRLARQAEIAVIGSYPLMAVVEQISSVDTQLSYTADGEIHLAGVQIDLALDFYQGPEDFAPVPVSEFDGVDVAVPAYAPFGASFDLEL